MTTSPENISSQNPPRDCAVLSAEQGEPLIGTAARVDVWFLLSYAGPMGAKAFAESTIPPDVKTYLNEQLDNIPHSRLLLIKPQPANNEGAVRFNVVLGSDMFPHYYAFVFDRYEDLLDLDISLLVAGNLPGAGPSMHTPFYVVCTNGRRDACCARRGLPVFKALKAQSETDIWQCSHVSGHRFAANVLMFPHGIYYGRITPAGSAALLEAGAAGHLLHSHYRGRAAYDSVVQAGEALLREATGNLGLDAYRFLGHQQAEDSLWYIRFADTANGQIHEITVRVSETGDRVFVGCRGEKQSPVLRYALEAHQLDGRSAG